MFGKMLHILNLLLYIDSEHNLGAALVTWPEPRPVQCLSFFEHLARQLSKTNKAIAMYVLTTPSKRRLVNPPEPVNM